MFFCIRTEDSIMKRGMRGFGTPGLNLWRIEGLGGS